MKKVILVFFVFVGFSAFSQCEDVPQKAIKKKSLSMIRVVVSPNPSMGHLHVNAPKGSVCQIISEKGTYVGTWNVVEDGFDIDGLSTGTYIAIIQDGNNYATRRFTVL